MEEFRRQLTAVSGHVHLVKDAAEARVQLRDILNGLDLQRATLTSHAILHDLELDALLQRMGLQVASVTGNPPPENLETAAGDQSFIPSADSGQALHPSFLRQTQDRLFILSHADLGLTGVEYAIAASGTLVMAAAPHHPRAVSLLPPLHIAILRREQILPDLAALPARLRHDFPGRLPSGLALITGPSRTGDIEQTLTIGAHGPGELYVIILQ